MTVEARASGALFGLAYGDALGAPTEFLSMKQIHQRYGSGGPRELTGHPALVTDDTQMTLAVAYGLLGALEDPPFAPDLFEPRLRRYFLEWLVDPENNRAPGMTCLKACRLMARGVQWRQATQHNSKGCGANMRVAPVGLVPGLSDEQRAGASQLQAALTHGHPTALAASELTAYAVWWLQNGMAPAELPAALRERCHTQRTTYHQRWLGDLWQRPAADSPADFISRGWDECLHALGNLEVALDGADRDTDPCTVTGAGWIAEEALVTGLLCFLLFPGDPVAAISRGAASSGDSDSIACLAGAFAGAHHGLGGWPPHWAGQIEYSSELRRIGAAWDRDTP
jgi:ADP-ribosylglycohydrolase